MIKVIYSEPELKDIIEGIIGKNFFILCSETIVQILNELDLPPKTMEQITITVLPHDDKSMGLASKTLHTVGIKIQDTAEENEKTLIHEALHILQPTWDEENTEKLTQKIYEQMYKKNSKEITI